MIRHVTHRGAPWFAEGAFLLLLAACGASNTASPPSPVAPTTVASPASAAPSGAAEDLTAGIAAVKTGDWTSARGAFEAAINKNAKQADAHYYLGLVMDKTGDKVAAEKSYRTALELQPELLEAAENLTALYVEAQKFEEAIVVAKKALARNAKSAEMQLNLAFALSGKGDVDSASKAFDDAIKLAPNDARFFIGYAQHLAAAKRRDDAVAKLKAAQRVAGDDAAILGTVGYEFKTLRAVPECISAFDKAIALKDNADFRTNRAHCKYAANDKPGAMADLQAAITKEPKFAAAHYWHGSWLHEDGKFPEALAAYETYLKIAPGGPMAKAAETKAKLAKEKKKPEKPAARK